MSHSLPSFNLPREELHVWQASLDRHERWKTEWTALLSDEERERAAAFHFDIHRERFIAARATLRILLGKYLNLPPQAVCFTHGSKGKPGIAGDPVYFNVSHSEDRALFAFSIDAPLGVDIEAIRPMPDALPIASRFFSTTESDMLSALPSHLRNRAFFCCWTRKEAVIKALGEGLSYPLESFSVSLDDPARVIAFEDATEPASQWMLYHLEPYREFIAAIATRAPGAQLRMRDVCEIEALQADDAMVNSSPC